mmetsp:Transcript_45169/g.139354  ORF Transcript_45169/g.139354 Transcript_45169/m.139354 type:complete len:343 (+) Transcript_45169:76-1104(+)
MSFTVASHSFPTSGTMDVEGGCRRAPRVPPHWAVRAKIKESNRELRHAQNKSRSAENDGAKNEPMHTRSRACAALAAQLPRCILPWGRHVAVVVGSVAAAAPGAGERRLSRWQPRGWVGPPGCGSRCGLRVLHRRRHAHRRRRRVPHGGTGRRAAANGRIAGRLRRRGQRGSLLLRAVVAAAAAAVPATATTAPAAPCALWVLLAVVVAVVRSRRDCCGRRRPCLHGGLIGEGEQEHAVAVADEHVVLVGRAGRGARVGGGLAAVDGRAVLRRRGLAPGRLAELPGREWAAARGPEGRGRRVEWRPARAGGAVVRPRERIVRRAGVSRQRRPPQVARRGRPW